MESPLLPSKETILQRIGRRGSCLLILACAFIFMGISPIFNHTQIEGQFHSYIPWPIRTAYWIVAAIIAIVAAFQRPPKSDGFGFIALIIPLMVTAISLFGSFASYIVFDVGSRTAWTSGVLYLAFAALIRVINTWPEVIEHPDAIDHRDQSGADA